MCRTPNSSSSRRSGYSFGRRIVTIFVTDNGTWLRRWPPLPPHGCPVPSPRESCTPGQPGAQRSQPQASAGVLNVSHLSTLHRLLMENPSLAEQLLETWEIHARINLYLLDAVPPEALGDRSASKGRTVGEQFAHVHNIRPT